MQRVADCDRKVLASVSCNPEAVHVHPSPPLPAHLSLLTRATTGAMEKKVRVGMRALSITCTWTNRREFSSGCRRHWTVCDVPF